MGRFWRKALAAALALLVVSGNVPIRSVADLFGGAAITANAEEGEAAFGQCGENATWELDLETGKLTIFGTGRCMIMAMTIGHGMITRAI